MSTIVSPRDENEFVLRPPQFRLRTLFVAMTVLGMLFALMAAIGPLASLVLAFALCLMACHVAGNAIGTTLRDRAAKGGAEETHSRSGTKANNLAACRHARLSGRQRLGEKTRLPRAATIVTLGGAVLGATVGGPGLALAGWQHITPGAVALAVVSSAVLGGFSGFLLSSFFSVIGPALREAARSDLPAVRPRAAG